MCNDLISICYKLTTTTDRCIQFNIDLDIKKMCLIQRHDVSLPKWTTLKFNQCPHCTLPLYLNPICPAASSLTDIVFKLNHVTSYTDIYLEVITPERTISGQTTVQRAISSLAGLLMATCGCPYTVFFKPMARFHMPLTNELETIYRASSMYLLAQYFLKEKKRIHEISLQGLTNIYKNVQIVNQGIAKRLRAATKMDSTINAVIILDIYAKTIPSVIDESLKEIQYLFEAFINNDVKDDIRGQ